LVLILKMRDFDAVEKGKAEGSLQMEKADAGLGQTFMNVDISNNSRLTLTLTVMWK
jgi:hypothetical protein